MLKLLNSFTNKLKTIKKNKLKKISLYVCGITPYNSAHLGHARCYITFDLLYRFLSFLNYNPIYCRNYTDIDDKIINAAIKIYSNAKDYKKIAAKFISEFKKEMRTLNCLTPTFEPKVTSNIDSIIKFIQQLITSKKAYVVNSDVYFEVAKFKKYGKLSKQKLASLESGARVQIDSNKKNPLDFALWKSDLVTGFKSPWGYGRPGWHIECSTIAKNIFNSKTINIHGGGADLLFPHHENEIAQFESLPKNKNKKFVDCWMHNAFVNINNEKMSKSLENSFLIKDILKNFTPMTLRFYFLKQHYKAPLNFKIDDLKATEKTYLKLQELLSNIKINTLEKKKVLKNSTIKNLIKILENDLNVSGFFGEIFKNLEILKANTSDLAALKYFLVNVFGLNFKKLNKKNIHNNKVELNKQLNELIEQREIARNNKDWKTADKIREKLLELNIKISDKKTSN